MGPDVSMTPRLELSNEEGKKVVHANIKVPISVFCMLKRVYSSDHEFVFSECSIITEARFAYKRS